MILRQFFHLGLLQLRVFLMDVFSAHFVGMEDACMPNSAFRPLRGYMKSNYDKSQTTSGTYRRSLARNTNGSILAADAATATIGAAVDDGAGRT